PGDVVHRGDIVAVVDTEKSDIEVEVFEDGVVEELLVGVGEEVEVGTPLARLGSVDGAAVPPPAPPPEPPAVEPEPAVEPAPRAKPARKPARRRRAPEPPAAADGRVRASPRARRLAAEAGVDLAGVAGSGPGGAVVAGDLSKPGTRPPSPEPTPA